MEAFDSILKFPVANSPEDVAFQKKFDENNIVTGKIFEYFDFLRSFLLKIELLPIQTNLKIYEKIKSEENLKILK
jgi:hypothetical protein